MGGGGWGAAGGLATQTIEDFQLFRNLLAHNRTQHKDKYPLSSQQGPMLIDIMDDHGLEQLLYFPTRENKHTLDSV